MKLSCWTFLTAVVLLVDGGPLALGASDDNARRLGDPSNPTFQLVFLSVLEGCFQDGLSDADVDQILLKTPQGSYVHFIYACPVCTATIYALESYRARTVAHMDKRGGKISFGGGLTADMHARLYSPVAKERLSALHDLEQNWVDRRVTSLRLDAQESAKVQQGLREARDEGTRMMQSFVEKDSLGQEAPAYHAGDECAVCNAAAGIALKLAPR